MKNQSINDKTNRAVFCWFYLYIGKINFYTETLGYSIFHDKHAIPWGIYYNSKNLEKDMERFRVLVFRQDEVIHGNIFVKVARGIADVFLHRRYIIKL